MSADVSARLAIMIAAPHGEQSSMHHDLAAMYQALKRRGLTSEEILCLEGQLDRLLLLGFFEAIHHRIAGSEQGTLFLYVSGHGAFTAESAQDARIGVALEPDAQAGDEHHILWSELLQALSVPRDVRLALLPDH